jgi:hypothetical protein
MSNWSDRGGSGSQISLVEQHNAVRGERADHPLLADVRSLNRDQIVELNAFYGHPEVAASKIAAAAVSQLANVRIAFGIDDGRPALGRERHAEVGTPMYERFREIDAAPDCSSQKRYGGTEPTRTRTTS